MKKSIFLIVFVFFTVICGFSGTLNIPLSGYSDFTTHELRYSDTLYHAGNYYYYKGSTFALTLAKYETATLFSDQYGILVRDQNNYTYIAESTTHGDAGDGLYPFTISGSKDITCYLYHGVIGRELLTSSTFRFRPDATAPTISTSATTTSWTNGNVTVSCSSSDTGSGISANQYSYNGSTWYNGASVTLTLNDTIYFRAIDNVGNISATSSYTVSNIDKTKPVVNSTSVIPGIWTNEDVTVTCSGSDTESGVNKYQYSSNGSTWYDGFPAPLSSNATVYFRTIDNAGNISATVSRDITNIDKTAPVISLTETPASWTNGNVDITVTTEDPFIESGSGVSGIAAGTLIYNSSLSHAVDGGISEYNNDGNSITMTVTQEGVNNIDFSVADVAGNTGDASVEIQIDRTIPVISYQLDSFFKDEIIVTSLTAADVDYEDGSQSGIDDSSWEYKIDETDIWTSFDSSEINPDRIMSIDISSTGINLVDGEHNIYFRLKDNAGNYSELYPGQKTDFTKDTVIPEVNDIVFNTTSLRTAFNDTIIFEIPTADDGLTGSGIDNELWEYSFNNIAWMELKLESAVDGKLSIVIPEDMIEGDNYLYLRVMDKVGNLSESKSGLFVIDQTAPDFSGAGVEVYYKDEDEKKYLETGGYIGNVIPYVELTGSWSADVTEFRYEIENDTEINEYYISAADALDANDITLSKFTEDNNYITIWAIDRAGNESAASVTKLVKFDNTIPGLATITGLTHPVATEVGDAVSESTAVFRLDMATIIPSGLSGYNYELLKGTNSGNAVALDVTVSGFIAGDELTLTELDDNAAGEFYFLVVKAVTGSGTVSQNASAYQFRIDSSPPESLTVYSSTHPLEAVTYGYVDATFKWVKPKDITGVKYYYVYSQEYENDDITILSGGTPTDLSGWTRLEVDTNDTVTYKVNLPEVIDPLNQTVLSGSICFAVAAEDYSGNLSFSERKVNYDIILPIFAFPGKGEVEEPVGDSIRITWPEADTQGQDDLLRYMVKVDKYENDSLLVSTGWINNLTSTSYVYKGFEEGYLYKAYVKIQDKTIPANEDVLMFEFSKEADGELTQDTPAVQPYSFMSKGYRVWGESNKTDDSDVNNIAYLEMPEALGFSVIDGIEEGDFIESSLLMQNSDFSAGTFLSGDYLDVGYSLSPGGLPLVCNGLSFSLAYGLELTSAVMTRRTGADETKDFVFNNLSISSPIEGTFEDNASIAQTAFDYQYQKEQTANSYIGEGWVLSGIESTLLSGGDWKLLNADADVKSQTGFEFYKTVNEQAVYTVDIGQTAVTETGEVRYGNVENFPYYLDLGTVGAGGSRLEIKSAAILNDRLAVYDAVLMFNGGITAEDEEGNPIDVHLRNFSLTLDGDLELFDTVGGTIYSSDEYYITSPYSGYRVKVNSTNISNYGVDIDGYLTGIDGMLDDSYFYGLDLSFDGIASSFDATLPGSGYTVLNGFTVDYTNRSMLPEGIRYNGASINLSAFDDGLAIDISGLTVDITDRTLIVVPGYGDTVFALDTPEYGTPSEGDSLTIKLLRLDADGLWGETVDVAVNTLLGDNYIYSNLPLLSDGKYGESAVRVDSSDLVLSGFTFPNSGSTFNGKRVVYSDIGITMPDGAYPFELTLDTLSATIDNLQLNADTNARYTYTRDGWTYLLRDVELAESGLKFLAETSMPSKFGGKKLSFNNFILNTDGSLNTGITDDLENQAVYIRLAGWIFEGRLLSIDGANLNIGRAFIDMPKRMGDGSIQFRNMIIARDGTLVAQGSADKYDEFTAINGFNVNPTNAVISGDELYLTGYVYFPSGLGAGNYVNYTAAEILLSGDGFITTPEKSYPDESYSIGGLPVTANDYSFERDGLHIGRNTFQLGGDNGIIGVLLEDVVFYPDGSVSVGGETLEDPDPLPFFGWIFSLENIRLTDLGIAADAGVTLPPALKSRVINFEELTLYEDESGNLKFKTDVVIPRFDFDIIEDQLNVDFRYISLADGDLEIKETIITLPEAMDKKRIRIGKTTYSEDAGFDLGGISMDPFPLWGYTLYLDNLDIDNDQISFEGRVKLPDDFYFEELAGETFEIATLVYHYDTGVVDFDIQYAGKTFELEDGWAITATNLSLGSDGFGIGEGTLHFPEDWTAVDGRLSVDSVGFNGLEIQYSPFLADFESIEANNIKVDLDTYEFTINKIEYNTTDGFILAGTFPMDGVFQGDSPVLNVQRLQVTTDFQMGDLIASLDGLEQDLFTGLTYNGGVGVSYVDDIVKMNASGDFVFSEDFVLEELRGTAVLVNSFEFNLSAMELVTIDADWSDDTITLFEQTINYPAITIDYNTDGVDDGISIAGNLVFPADFPALGNEELILYVKSDFSGTLTDVAAGISITGPKKFIDDTWLRDFEVIAGLNETKNGLLLDLTGTVVLGDSFPDGLAGVSTTITSLVVDTFGGLKEFDAAINFPTLTLMDSFDIQNASIGFATAVGQDFLISLGGTIVLPDTFPEGLAGNAVNITDFSFSPTGGIYNVDISMSGINTALWDIIDLQNGSFSVTNNGNDELLFGFGGDLVLPEDLGEDLGGTIVNITDFVISTKTGIVSFNAGIATPIVFELFAGIDAAITKLNISETGISLAGNITFPDTFPEGLAGLTVGLDEFSMTWQGDITALSAGIPYVDITVAGFNAEATNISFGSNGLNIESLVLVMPENMNGTTVAVENAGIDTDGNFYGEVVIPFISIDMAGFTVRLDEPGLDLENQEISFSKASLIAPELIGGWSMEVNGVKINPSGIQFTGGKFSIPDFAIAGGLGFQGVFVDFMLDGQIYIIGGGGAVLVPGLGKMSAEVSFTNISSTYPIGLRYAKFEYTISAPGLPLGSTGINLHSIRGSIAFGPATEVPSQLRYMFDGSMRLSLGLTLTDSSGGYVVRGDMDVWVDVYDWEWAFKGNISVLNGVARGEAIAALGRSGFYTSLSVQIAFVRGSVEFYIFEYNNRTTVSGRGSVQLGIPAGIIWEGWIYFPKPWKPWYCQIPDSTIWGPSVGAEFGMFSKSGATVSGFKGYIPNVPGLGTVGVFMPSNGSPDMNFTSYTLYTPGRSRSLTADTGVGVLKGEIENGVYYSPEISEEPVMYSFNTGGGDELILSRSLSSESNPSSDMERLVFMVLHGDGEPEITAISPSGVYYSYGDSGTETIYSSWGMSFVVYNPEPGEWSVEVENMPDPDSYIIQVLGKQLIPELEVTSPSYSTETDGSVTINGTVSTPDGNPGDIEIYVSNDADSFTGKLAGTVTSAFDGIFTYELDTTNLAEGEYYVYASYRYLETPAVRIYADGSIRKSSEEALAAVTDIIAAGTPDGDMSLQFSNPNGERAKGYNVYYETMVDGVPEVRSYNIGNITKVALSGFTAETEGEFYVVPYNSRNETGPESEHIAVSFVTPASPEPVNDFTVDTNNIAVECPIGENVTSEITLTGVAPVVTGTASDYIGVDINDLPTGVMLVFDDYVKNISEGEAVFEYTVVCADNTGVGNYEFNLSFYNLTDSRTEETIDISLNTVMPEVKISELSETEIINTAEKQLFIYGDYFFDGTRLYLDGEELEVDDLSRYTITVTLPAGIDAGTRTLTVEGPGGNTATAALDVIEPYYLVKAYNTEITLSTGDEFSIPFSIMGMYGYEDSASFNLTEIPEGWNVSLSDSQINPGDNALINGYIPITESTGIFTIALSADSGAEVTYTINITDTAPTPTINGLSAASVFAGESFDIYGYGFGTNSTVTLSGEELTINSCKATIINVQLDEESESGVIVVNRDGVSSNEKNIYVKHKGFNIYSEEETLLMQAEETYSLELVIAGLSEEVQLSVETDNDDLGATLSKTTIVPNGVSELTIQSGSLIENGTYYVTVSGISEDIQKQKMITVTVGDAFTFETEELSSGIQDSEYYASIITANGEAPVTFSLTDGDLPTGLKLSDTGIISGTPVKAGTDNFTIESVDDYGRTIEQEFSITIEENVWFREGKDAGLSRYNPVPGPADSRKLWSLDGSSATAMLTDLISGDGFIYAWSSEKLSAFNAKSGNSLYSIEGEIHKAVYAAGSLYVLNGTNLEVYDAPYGTLKWIREGVTTFTTNAGSLITDEESGLCVLEMSGTLKNTIAGDLPETEIIWFNSMPHYTSGSDLIALTDTGWETVYTADSGSLLTGSVSGEYLYMAGDEQIIVLDTDYSTVITASTNTAVRATGITGSRLVILGDESLSSYDADSLEQVFTTEIAAARMALTREKIFLTGDAGTTALNAYTGDVIWNEETPAEDLISAGEYIYRLYKEGGLVCYNGPYNIEKPVTEMSVEPAAADGKNGYYVTTPIVTLTSTDAETYAAEVMYKLNDTGYINYIEEIELPEGLVSMSWYAVDNHKYHEDPQIEVFNVDTDAPVTELLTEGDENVTGYFNSDTVTLSLSASDAVSGVEGIYYNLDGVDGEYGSPIYLSNQGEYTLTYWSEDNAGNVEDNKTFNITIDRDKPQVKLSRQIQPGLGIITLEASDRLAGIDKVYYSFNGGAWVVYTAPLALPEGRYEIEYYAVDKSGNESNVSRRNLRVPPGPANDMIEIGLTGDGDLYTPDADINLSCTSSSALENVIWYLEIENQDAVVIGEGENIAWTVPYTADSMILTLRAGADLSDLGYTAYATKIMLIENRKSVDWNSLDRHDYYSGRTLPFDPEVTDARGELVDNTDIAWNYTINDGDAQNLDITDGIWSIPEDEGRIRITGSFAETRDVTGTVTKEGYIIDIDNITRATVMGLEGESEPWYRTAVTMLLRPTGRAVRVDEIKYSLDGGEYETYQHAINLNEQGEYSIQWYGVLPDGTEETAHSLSLSIDYEVPISEAGITTVNDVEYLALTAEDNLSGIARIEYKLPRGEVQQYSEILEMSDDVLQMQYRAVDVAGNTERWNRLDWRKIRRPRSRCRIEENAGTDGWYRELPGMILEALDGESMDSIQYSLNGSEEQNYNSVIEPAADGYHTLSWKGRGADGREDLEQRKVIKIDRTPPEVSRNIELGSGRIELELTAWDDASGIQRTEYRLNGGPVMIYHGIVELGTGDWNIEYRSIDRAGNETEWITISVYVPAEGDE